MQPRSSHGAALPLPHTAVPSPDFDEKVKSLWSQMTVENAFQTLTSTLLSTSVWDTALTPLIYESYPDRVALQRILCQRYASVVGFRRLEYVLKLVMLELCRSAWRLRDGSSSPMPEVPDDPDRACHMLADFARVLRETGLASPCGERAFADALHQTMQELVSYKYGTNETRASIVQQIENTVSDDVMRFIDAVWTMEAQSQLRQKHFKQLFLSTALETLSHIRARQLHHHLLTGRRSAFNEGAEEDLRTLLKDPLMRQSIAKHLTGKLQYDMLQPGSTTVRILEIYVRLINALLDIELSGVVLQSVSKPIVSFLRSRKDVIRILISSLLGSPRDEHGNTRMSTETFCASVAQCMEVDSNRYASRYYVEPDSHESKWMPDPVDAAVGHDSNRYQDTFSHLVDLETREKFESELQSVFAARIIGMATTAQGRTEETTSAESGTFQAELRLLNAIKQRRPNYEIGNCEIMLRDMLDSERLNAEIRTGAGRPTSSSGPAQITGIPFNAVVLSRCYWPIMPHWDSGCPWTPEVQTSAKQWASAYGKQKKQRRLEWLPSAGRAKVELELADRTVVEECAPFQAAVIQQFHSASTAESAPQTIDQLAEATELDADLVRAACQFWVSRDVLVRDARNRDAYAVLERLPKNRHSHAHTPDRSGRDAAPAEATLAPKAKTPAEQLQENGDIYAQFINALLTNQGAMNAARIRTMLRMAVPGGFPFEEDDLLGFLENLGSSGKVARQGDLWAASK